MRIFWTTEQDTDHVLIEQPPMKRTIFIIDNKCMGSTSFDFPYVIYNFSIKRESEHVIKKMLVLLSYHSIRFKFNRWNYKKQPYYHTTLNGCYESGSFCGGSSFPNMGLSLDLVTKEAINSFWNTSFNVTEGLCLPANYIVNTMQVVNYCWVKDIPKLKWEEVHENSKTTGILVP